MVQKISLADICVIRILTIKYILIRDTDHPRKHRMLFLHADFIY